MKDLVEFIASYPLWVKLAIVALTATMALLLVVFRPSPQPSMLATPSSSAPTSSGSAVTVGDKASPLIVGNVQAKADGSTFLDISRAGRIEHVPITLIIDVPRQDPRHYDYSILFDVTNSGSSDLRIVDVFVRTLQWQELEQIVRYVPLAGLGETRRFLCIIDKEPRHYRATLDQSASYLRLKPGALETIALMVTALHEGKYSVQVELEYSVGGRTGTSVIGPIDDIRFLDRNRIGVLPR